jgi:hypothetical protein
VDREMMSLSSAAGVPTYERRATQHHRNGRVIGDHTAGKA